MADENDDSISQIDPDELMRRVLGGDSSEMSPMRTSGGGSPAAPPPDPNPAPAMPSSGFDPSKLPPGLLASPMTPNTVPQPPTGSNNPNLVDLLKQQGANKPVDAKAVDPATGKPMYKMGTGQRVLGTVGNFLQGFGGKPFTPTYVGPGATNARYSQDVARQQATAGHLGTQIQGQEKLDTENEKMYRDATRQAYEGQVGEARKATAAAQQENADTRKSLEASQAARNDADAELKRTKAGTEPEPRTEAEIALALQTAKLKGDKQGIAKYGGALQELAKQKAAGRAPKDTTAADITKALGVAKFRTDEHDKINREQDSEREKRYAELDKDITIKYDPAKMAAAKAKVAQDLEAKYVPRHQKADADSDQMLGLTKSGASLKTGATQPSAGASKIDPNNLPKTVMVNGKERKVVGYNSQTKKVKVAPAGE